ncbi:unnamed protein product [Closterium sp. NIES-54]
MSSLLVGRCALAFLLHALLTTRPCHHALPPTTSSSCPSRTCPSFPFPQDFRNLTTIVEWLAWAEPEYDFKPVVGEWVKEVLKELDFRLEAANLERVARNFQQHELAGGSVGVESSSGALAVEAIVPAVVRATERVLVMEFVQGVRLSDLPALDALQVDRQVLLNRIARPAPRHMHALTLCALPSCAFLPLYIIHSFPPGTHAGNFLVSDQPPHLPVLLDFGLTKAVDHAKRVALAKMLLAAAEVGMGMGREREGEGGS